ncbi:branched-chain amino acid ABC transporter permease [Pollutimonas bauzanensis]|uniref:Amino acid/amide ABC transporter membrane protein 2, HAAT family n=1 Tax=Pollutimonas bauzanensis TaxID=658167 RepID=A0A1M5QU17_9BURK|nr:branched-chain amino acid ABC transporter permease [Pollutimonas bauzanensis]SHH17209.1 amino acid/amide ABC transporter membrane protein 2, HAAT family [Pollutimonas bauzanensis]
MSSFLSGQLSLFELVLVNGVLAYSQYIALRAGVFSLATAGFASLGAYAAALLALRFGLPAGAGLLAAASIGALAGALLAWPLARLRGVFQAIATLAFVQIVMSISLYWESLTGGALGLNGIPNLVGPGHLLVVVAIVLYLLKALSGTGIGRAFDTIRQDETVAVSLGISVVRHQRLAFALSGALGGLGGGLVAYRNYSLVPEDFGFPLIIAALGFVVLGGRNAVLGPLAGALILTLLPEVARPLADYRLAVNGALMVLAIIYWPYGVVDTLGLRWRRRKAERLAEAQP